MRISGAISAYGIRHSRAHSPDQRQVEDQQHHVAHVHAGDHRPHELRLLLEQQRPGLQAVDHQPAQHHRERGRGRNAKGEERDESRARGGVVRALRRRHALDRALAEALRRLRHAPLDVVRDERDRARRAPGQEPEPEAHAGRAQHRADARLDLGPRRQQLAERRQRDRARRASTPSSTSVIAKSPMITAMKSMPPSSVVVPYAKRRAPDMGSRPTSAMSAPSAAALRPFTSEAPDRLTTTLNARTTSPKYSGGPIAQRDVRERRREEREPHETERARHERGHARRSRAPGPRGLAAPSDSRRAS